jgi:hypothetical protein
MRAKLFSLYPHQESLTPLQTQQHNKLNIQAEALMKNCRSRERTTNISGE